MLVLRLTPPTPQAPYIFFAGALPLHPVKAETQLPDKPKLAPRFLYARHRLHCLGRAEDFSVFS